MKITCIGTGSSGNMFHVRGKSGTSVFLDAGIPPKAVQRLNVPIANTPIFITHEHGDHAKYAKKYQNDYGCPICCSLGTAEALKLKDAMIPKQLNDLDNPTSLQKKRKRGLTETRMFPVVHTAEEPTGFYLVIDGEALIYLADAGMPPFVWHIPIKPDVMILESNYTKKRLAEQAEKSESHLFVAGRVSSGVGHLSANDTFEFAKDYYKHSDLIILFHQSKNNFDYKEFYEDKEIDEDFKSRVVFASPDMAWDTVPF
jgi:phosphoribosyl 1,2-cyclic phosphodiesterase